MKSIRLTFLASFFRENIILVKKEKCHKYRNKLDCTS